MVDRANEMAEKGQLAQPDRLAQGQEAMSTAIHIMEDAARYGTGHDEDALHHWDLANQALEDALGITKEKDQLIAAIIQKESEELPSSQMNEKAQQKAATLKPMSEAELRELPVRALRVRAVTLGVSEKVRQKAARLPSPAGGAGQKPRAKQARVSFRQHGGGGGDGGADRASLAQDVKILGLLNKINAAQEEMQAELRAVRADVTELKAEREPA